MHREHASAIAVLSYLRFVRCSRASLDGLFEEVLLKYYCMCGKGAENLLGVV